MYPVRLTGRGVVLRELGPDDLEAITAIVNDPEVTYWLSFDQRDRTEAASMLEGILDRANHQPRTEYYLGITQPPDDRIVGFCRLALSGVNAAKLGWAIAADHWGQGLATDAAATITDFGFTTLELHRISAAIGPTNQASVAVATKLGMTYEGRIRDHVYTNGQWRDSLLYSILTNEWLRPAQPARDG